MLLLLVTEPKQKKKRTEERVTNFYTCKIGYREEVVLKYCYLLNLFTISVLYLSIRNHDYMELWVTGGY